MADNDDYSSDSDDEDYVPIEVESDGNDGVSSGSDETETDLNGQTKGEKRTKKQNKTNKSKRRAGLRPNSDRENSDCSNDDTKDSHNGKVEMTEEEEKNLSNALWSDFLKDTNQASKKNSPSKTTSNSTVENSVGSSEKIEVTKVFNFAGEDVKVKEYVSVNENTKEVKESEQIPQPSPSFKTNKPAGGLGSILGKISGKSPKLSTLEKSKLDWNEYKSDEGIEEELHNHNKGRDGYLDRQAFLQRTDLRQFEIERNLRSLNRR